MIQSRKRIDLLMMGLTINGTSCLCYAPPRDSGNTDVYVMGPSRNNDSEVLDNGGYQTTDNCS